MISCLLVFGIGLSLSVGAEAIYRDSWVSPSEASFTVTALPIGNPITFSFSSSFGSSNSLDGGYLWQSNSATSSMSANTLFRVTPFKTDTGLHTTVSFTIWLMSGTTSTVTIPWSFLQSVQVQVYKAFQADTPIVKSFLVADAIVQHKQVGGYYYYGYTYTYDFSASSDYRDLNIFYTFQWSPTTSQQFCRVGISSVHVYQTADNSAELPIYSSPGYDAFSEYEGAESALLGAVMSDADIAGQLDNATSHLNTFRAGFTWYQWIYSQVFEQHPFLYGLLVVSGGLGLFGLLLNLLDKWAHKSG